MRAAFNASNKFAKRDGAMVPLVALLLPVFLGLVILAFDYGVISLGRQHLQNAADAGATAALVTYLEERSSADQAALEVIGTSRLLGTEIEFDVFESVRYGRWNDSTKTFTEIERTDGSDNIAAGETIPIGANAVQVRLLRSPETNNGLQLFFAPLIGTNETTIVAEAVAATSPPCIGFVGIDSALIENNATTDSYDSTQGPYNPGTNRSENGGICSEGIVTLSSGANIFGSVSGSSVDIVAGSNAMISGTIAEGEPLEFDPVVFPSTNDNGIIERGPLWAPPFYNSSTGDLVIDNGRNLRLTTGTYRFRNLFLRGGSELWIDGQVTIFVEQELVFDNGTVANLGQLPQDFVLNVDAGPVNIQGGHQLHGIIYAPEADVSVANGSGFFGSIIGRTLEFAGGGGLHYDESLVDPSRPTPPPKLVF